jgi:hypothetical protein
MSDYPMLISNKLHSFRNFVPQILQVLFLIFFFSPHQNTSSPFNVAELASVMRTWTKSPIR